MYEKGQLRSKEYFNSSNSSLFEKREEYTNRELTRIVKRMNDFLFEIDPTTEIILFRYSVNREGKTTGPVVHYKDNHPYCEYVNSEKLIQTKKFSTKNNNLIMEEYDKEGNRVYEGMYCEERGKFKRHGEGEEYLLGVLQYRGNWDKGKRKGKGTSFYKGKKKYQGEWDNGLPHGYGTYHETGKEYEGEWIQGKMYYNERKHYDYMKGQLVRTEDPLYSTLPFEDYDSLCSLKENIESININEMWQNIPTFHIHEFTCLRVLIVASSLQNCNSFRVEFCQKIHTIKIKNACCNTKQGDFFISDCKELRELKVKKNSFVSYLNLVVKSFF